MGDRLDFNGVDALTGDYLSPSVTSVSFAEQIRKARPLSQEMGNWLKNRQDDPDRAHLGVSEDVDPLDLASAGWGVIFPSSGIKAIDGSTKSLEEKAKATMEFYKKRLAPLLAHREKQVGGLYKEYVWPDPAWAFDKNAAGFLASHNARFDDPVNPSKVPYYLLIVGPPEVLSFEFQCDLDIPHAVGRVHFDEEDAWLDYAEAVVSAEKSDETSARSAGFFAVDRKGDRSTQKSARYLVAPLCDELRDYRGWQTALWRGDRATKEQLSGVMGSPPSLLFSATHGAVFPSAHPSQVAEQGALVCQGWAPGQPIKKRQRFSASDLGDVSLKGMVAFQFACFGAGTPHKDTYPVEPAFRGTLAPRAFVSRLPQEMLRKGALAVIGHVDRGWSVSFKTLEAGTQRGAFRDTLKRLMKGQPVGHATEYFDLRHSALGVQLHNAWEGVRTETLADLVLADLWLTYHDARNFVVLGDPAVRLSLDPWQEEGKEDGDTPINLATTTPTTVQEGVAVLMEAIKQARTSLDRVEQAASALSELLNKGDP